MGATAGTLLSVAWMLLGQEPTSAHEGKTVPCSASAAFQSRFWIAHAADVAQDIIRSPTSLETKALRDVLQLGSGNSSKNIGWSSQVVYALYIIFSDRALVCLRAMARASWLS